MPPEWTQILFGIVSSAPFLALLTWWLKVRRDDRLAEKAADLAEITALRKQIFDMQQERIHYEMVRRESTDHTMKVLAELHVLLKAKEGRAR